MLFLITIATVALLSELSGAKFDWRYQMIMYKDKYGRDRVMRLMKLEKGFCGRRRVEGSGSGTAIKECQAKFEAMIEFCETLESEPACQKFEEYLNETTNPDCDWLKLKEKTFKLFGSMVKAGQIVMEAVMEKAAENDDEETAGTVDPEQRRILFPDVHGQINWNDYAAMRKEAEFGVLNWQRRAEEESGNNALVGGGFELEMIDTGLEFRRAEEETEEVPKRRAEEEWPGWANDCAECKMGMGVDMPSGGSTQLNFRRTEEEIGVNVDGGLQSPFNNVVNSLRRAEEETEEEFGDVGGVNVQLKRRAELPGPIYFEGYGVDGGMASEFPSNDLWNLKRRAEEETEEAYYGRRAEVDAARRLLEAETN